MPRAALKSMTRRRDVKLGHFIVEFATPGIGHIVKAAGADFVLLDMEHSGFGIETVKSALRYFEAADVPVIVRVPTKEYHHIARICDVGAEGIMVPMVSSASDVRAILDSMKYHPEGKRGVALSVSHDNFTLGAVDEKLKDANARTTFFCLVETEEGVRNIDEIAASDGVDCIWIGHFDLSFSLGIPGQFDHPKFKQAVEKIVAAAKRHNRALGRLVPTTDAGIELYKQGFDFCCYSGDVWVLRDALSSAFKTLRAGCPS